MAKEDFPVIVAAVEAGGTSFNVAVAQILKNDTIPQILHRSNIETKDDPLVTLAECANFFEKHKPEEGGYDALGVASFGPVGLVESTNTYGKILPGSPKANWRSVDLLTPLAKACKGKKNLCVKIETDVNAPAFAEYLFAKKEISSVAYVTVGTGVGVGLVINGETVHGLMHPEGGHVPIHALPGDKFDGYSWGESSPFHGKGTVEGMASSVALTERLEMMTGQKNLSRSSLADLDDDHEIWYHAANALANLCTTLVLMTSVERIVFGGGVMNRTGLLEKIRKRTVELSNGYLDLPGMSTFIVASAYGSDSGLTGALLLARQAYEDSKDPAKKKKSGGMSPFNVGVIHGVFVGAAVAYFGMLLVRASKR